MKVEETARRGGELQGGRVGVMGERKTEWRVFSHRQNLDLTLQTGVCDVKAGGDWWRGRLGPWSRAGSGSTGMNKCNFPCLCMEMPS